MSAIFTNNTYEPLPSDSDTRLEAKIALMLYALATGQITLQTSGGVTPPGGSSGQPQYNNAGAFGGFTGLTIAGGALTNVSIVGGTVVVSTPVLNLSQTWNDGAVAFTGIFANFTSTASAGGSLVMDLQVGGSSLFSLRKDGFLTCKGPISIDGANSLVVGSNAGLDANRLYVATVALGTGFGIDCTLVRNAAGVVESNGSFRTAAPASGTAANWKFGSAASVSPTSPNRTIELDVGGTIYYLHAKTTNN